MSVLVGEMCFFLSFMFFFRFYRMRTGYGILTQISIYSL